MKRALCIWLPQWPLQRLAAARAELSHRAVVLYQLHSSGGAKVVAYCPRLDQAALTDWQLDRVRGIRPGMPLAEATALALRISTQPSGPSRGCFKTGAQKGAVPFCSQGTAKSGLPPAGFDIASSDAEPLHLEPVDPAADRAALEALADDCQRFAPLVGIEESAPADSLLLDISGLAPLCGGEELLARKIVADFRERRLAVRVALADTLGAAWAAAHFSPLPCTTQEPGPADLLAALGQPVAVPAGETRNALAALPPDALRLPAETCQVLAELGLKRIAQLAALPRETLLARFGSQVLLRLDQALGHAAEAIAARAVPAQWTFEWLFEHPTGRREMIEWTVEQLVARVCGALASQRQGVLRLACRFLPEQGTAVEFVVGLYRPSASSRHLEELVRLKLEAVRFRQPLASICLQVLALDALEFQQQEIFAALEESRDAPRELAGLVDRLSNRLGAHAVVRPWLLTGAQPEFTCQYRPVASLKTRRGRNRRADMSVETRLAWQPGDRPLALEPQPQALDVVSVVPEGPPIRFRFAGEDHRIGRSWGPERIETGWWRGRCIRRDYYQVETTTGERYWLFRQLNSGQWFLHGAFF